MEGPAPAPMNVYFVLSEYLKDSASQCDPPEPPEGGCIALIVVAKSRGQARYLAWRSEEKYGSGSAADMPAFATRKIGTTEGEPHVVQCGEDRYDEWWWLAPQIDAPNPPRKPKAQFGWNPSDVAIMGGDPSL